jgi:hypothetical protein
MGLQSRQDAAPTVDQRSVKSKISTSTSTIKEHASLADAAPSLGGVGFFYTHFQLILIQLLLICCELGGKPFR